jgi:hypothetical protein
LSEEVGGKGPAKQAKTAEVGNDRRHRGSDDRDVNRGHEARHHHGRQHQSPRGFGIGRGAPLQLLSGGRLIEQCHPAAKRKV